MTRISGILFSLIFSFLLFTKSYTSFAQSDNTRYEIQTEDGNIYRGVIMEKEISSIKFNTDNIGIITIKFDDIKKIEKLNNSSSSTNQAAYYRTPEEVQQDEDATKEQHPAPQVYLIKPSSFGLKKGEAYYQNIWLLFNAVNIGLTDYMSLGIGGILIPSIDTSIPAWISPKFTIPVMKDKVHLGLGSVNGAFLGNDPYSFGMLYGDIGVGSDYNHVSFGLGTTYDDGRWLDEAVFTFSGVLRLGRSFSITTENYVLKEQSFYSAYAYHHLSPQVVLQYGLIIQNDNFDSFTIPMLGILVPLNVKF